MPSSQRLHKSEAEQDQVKVGVLGSHRHIEGIRIQGTGEGGVKMRDTGEEEGPTPPSPTGGNMEGPRGKERKAVPGEA